MSHSKLQGSSSVQLIFTKYVDILIRIEFLVNNTKLNSSKDFIEIEQSIKMNGPSLRDSQA